MITHLMSDVCRVVTMMNVWLLSIQIYSITPIVRTHSHKVENCFWFGHHFVFLGISQDFAFYFCYHQCEVGFKNASSASDKLWDMRYRSDEGKVSKFQVLTFNFISITWQNKTRQSRHMFCEVILLIEYLILTRAWKADNLNI